MTATSPRSPGADPSSPSGPADGDAPAPVVAMPFVVVVGADDAPVCVDGVCALPPAAPED